MHLVGVVLALRGVDEEREAVSSIAPMEYFLSVCSQKIYALTQCPSKNNGYMLKVEYINTVVPKDRT